MKYICIFIHIGNVNEGEGVDDVLGFIFICLNTCLGGIFEFLFDISVFKRHFKKCMLK